MRFLRFFLYFRLWLLFIMPAGIIGASSSDFVDEDVIEEEVVVQPPPKKSVIILNNQQVEQKVQGNTLSQQPAVRVEGQAITRSRATELMQSRKDAEIQTEQKIVERLERSRLRDEQERLSRILNEGTEKTVVPRQETGDYRPQKPQPTLWQEEEDEDPVFVGFHFGFASNLGNRIEGSYGSYGASVGAADETGLAMEAGVFYSLHEVSRGEVSGFGYWYNSHLGQYRSPFTDVDQLTGSVALKFTPFGTRLKPYMAVVGLFSLWMYDNSGDDFLDYSFCPVGVGYGGRQCGRGQTTHSLDVGVQAGLDIKLSARVSVGLQLLVNVWNFYNNNDALFRNYYWTNNTYDYSYRSSAVQDTTLERTRWMIATANIKVYF